MQSTCPGSAEGQILSLDFYQSSLNAACSPSSDLELSTGGARMSACLTTKARWVRFQSQMGPELKSCRRDGVLKTPQSLSLTFVYSFSMFVYTRTCGGQKTTSGS